MLPVSNSGMEPPHRDVPPKLTAAVLFLCTAASIAYVLLRNPFSPYPGRVSAWDSPLIIAAEASPLIFVIASILLFLKPRLGFLLGLAAGLIALPWFVRSEFLLGPWNSWILLNDRSSTQTAEGVFSASVTWKILATGLTVIAVVFASLRLSALYRRTWPAFAAGFLVVATWFVDSVTPYQVAGFDHGRADLRILHIQKRGRRIQETTVCEFRNRQVLVWRDDRRLFQYRFEVRVTVPDLAATTVLDSARRLVESPELLRLHTAFPKALRSWNADGWYVVLKDSRILAFSSEYGTAPPEQVTGLFHEIEQLPASERLPFTNRDVCLGFCYDPVAALGFSVLSQRARLRGL